MADDADWERQLEQVERDIADRDRRIADVMASIKPIQEEKAHLEALRTAIRGWLSLRGKPPEQKKESYHEAVQRLEQENLATVNRLARRRIVRSPRQVMLKALRESGRPMSPDELWLAAAAEGFTSKQTPEAAANFSMYGAKSEHNDPIERLPSGEWVWRGSGLSEQDNGLRLQP